jgi:molecular chaperone GrpE
VSSKPETKEVSDKKPPPKEQQDLAQQLRFQLKELGKAKQESDKKAAEYFERLQRLQADMENLQKITKRQIETMTGQASRDLTVRLLPILDALRQAGNFAHGGESLPPEEVAVGLDMLYGQLMDVLRTGGLEEISAVGQLLDPDKHEVVSYVERDDEPENTVVEEVRKGYILGGKVVRPTMVIVTKPKVAPKETENPSK